MKSISSSPKRKQAKIEKRTFSREFQTFGKEMKNASVRQNLDLKFLSVAGLNQNKNFNSHLE